MSWLRWGLIALASWATINTASTVIQAVRGEIGKVVFVNVPVYTRFRPPTPKRVRVY